MAEKKSFLRKPIWFGFFLSALFITLLITVYITQNISSSIREKVTNELVEECSKFGFTGIQLERCIQKSKDGGQLPNIKVEDCGGCGKQQLCLVGEDKLFCEKNISENSLLIKIGAVLDSLIIPILNINTKIKGIIIAMLFLIGIGIRKFNVI